MSKKTCTKCKNDNAVCHDNIGYFCNECIDNILKDLIGEKIENTELLNCKQCNRYYLPQIDNNGHLKDTCKICYRKNYAKSKQYLVSIQDKFCSHGLHDTDKKCIPFDNNKALFIKKQFECILHRECLSQEFMRFEMMNDIKLFIVIIDGHLQKKSNIGKTWSDIYLDTNTEYTCMIEAKKYFTYANIHPFLIEDSKIQLTEFEENYKKTRNDVFKHAAIRQEEYGVW